MPLSAVDCIQPAIQHTKEQLFTRSRFGQWARLALVAILAGELHVGSCNFGNFPQMLAQSRRGSSGQEFLLPNFPHIDPARLAQFAGLIAVIVLMAIIFFFVFLYLNSVFRFILFESVIRRECSIGGGWERWHPTGRRFFLWQIVFIISTWIFIGLLIGIPLMFMGGAGWFKNSSLHAGGILGSILLLVGIFLIVALVLAVVQILAKDFLVSIMALEGVDFGEGWSRLFAMMRPELGRYVIYVLMKIVLSIAAAILFGIAAIIPALVVGIPCVLIVLAVVAAGATWNVATISMAVIFGTIAIALLVYLMALVAAPGTIFFPAYALYFFAGRYPNLNALLYPAPPAPAPPPAPEIPPPLSPSPEPIG